MAKTDLTAQRLRELLSYDPETGVFCWIKPPQGRAFTSPVGSSDNNGYQMIGVDYGKYKAHRLAWLHVYGEWPARHIDHINRDKADNRISNLRVVNDSENQQNRSAPNTNTSGHKGVHMAKRPRKWKAQAWLNGKCFHFGYFDRLNDAIAAYNSGVARIHTHFPI